MHHFSILQPRLAAAGGKNRELHSRLLVEPITIPNLDHTGVKHRLVEQDKPVFYPTGTKSMKLREILRSEIK